MADYRDDYANLRGDENIVVQDLIDELKGVLPEPLNQAAILALLVALEETLKDASAAQILGVEQAKGYLETLLGRFQ